jgi:hypothetical protein
VTLGLLGGLDNELKTIHGEVNKSKARTSQIYISHSLNALRPV